MSLKSVCPHDLPHCCHWNSNEPVCLRFVSEAIVMQMCIAAGAYDQRQIWHTWHEILKFQWFVYWIIPPHLPTSNTVMISKHGELWYANAVWGDIKTLCSPSFSPRQAATKLLLILVSDTKCSIKFYLKMPLVNPFHSTSYTCTHKCF